MRIGIAADHGGFVMKERLADDLRSAGHVVTDFGATTYDKGDDYPDFVVPLARAVAGGSVERGIALCSSGVGAAIAANKVAGVRAALIHDGYSAHQGVEDDDMNMISLGSQVVGYAEAWELVRTFLVASFSGAERHKRRLAKVAALERGGEAAERRRRQMQLGMIGVGRMGGEMVRRLLRGGHQCVVYDRSAEAVAALAREGAAAAGSVAELVSLLDVPRTIWLMLPAAAVDTAIGTIASLLAPGDTLIDGGNSHYHDDIRRSRELAGRGIAYLDVGTSGGVWGLERGYCLMIGGEGEAVARLEPLFATLAPGGDAVARSPARAGARTPAELGYLHCGPSGAGHFVKMVHNGIEYGLMAAYAEGFNILRQANAGKEGREADAETAPLRHPEFYSYDFDLAEVAELWRRGSVVSSWLLDLCATALHESPGLDGFAGRVADSGEGRWSVTAAIDEGVPAPVLSTALYGRFASRGASGFADRLLSAMRYQFGGHREKPAAGDE